jgi:hypothetical protein
MGENFLEQTLLPQTEGRQLVIKNRIDRDRSLGEPEREFLLAGVQGPEALGPDRDEAGIANAIDQAVVLRQISTAGNRGKRKRGQQQATGWNSHGLKGIRPGSVSTPFWAIGETSGWLAEMPGEMNGRTFDLAPAPLRGL